MDARHLRALYQTLMKSGGAEYWKPTLRGGRSHRFSGGLGGLNCRRTRWTVSPVGPGVEPLCIPDAHAITLQLPSSPNGDE